MWHELDKNDITGIYSIYYSVLPVLWGKNIKKKLVWPAVEDAVSNYIHLFGLFIDNKNYVYKWNTELKTTK